jgi:hypothetical protein
MSKPLKAGLTIFALITLFTLVCEAANAIQLRVISGNNTDETKIHRGVHVIEDSGIEDSVIQTKTKLGKKKHPHKPLPTPKDLKDMDKLLAEFGVPKNLPKEEDDPLVLLEQCAERKDAEARDRLGVWYYCSSRMSEDRLKGLWLIQEAAAQGHPRALYNKGVMCCFGEGFEKKSNEGLLLLHQAEEKGYSKAKKAIDILSRSDSVSQDSLEELKWWPHESAAQRQGDVLRVLPPAVGKILRTLSVE